MKKQEIINTLETNINTIFGSLMLKENIKHGDITPQQAINLDNNINEIANIIIEVIKQNK